MPNPEAAFWQRLSPKTQVEPEPVPAPEPLAARCTHPEEMQMFSHNYRARCQCGAVNVCGDWWEP